jgi:glycosyltransferase involved in cell wall biosynthesis
MTSVMSAGSTTSPGAGSTHSRWLDILRPRRSVHVINPFWDARGGSELRAVSLYNELKESCSVRLWTEFRADPALARVYPIDRIAVPRLRFPMRGTFVFVGVYTHPGRWLYLTRPRRVIVIYNTPDPKLLSQLLKILARRLARPVEIVYASEAQKLSVAYPGVVQASPIDLELFTPGERGASTGKGGEFTVGRLSRDIPEKHHHLDSAFYQRLAETGVRVQIMGGTCLATQPSSEGWDHGRVELLPVGWMAPNRFLSGLDCFFYRTAEHWNEPFGRVVMEAMACGLPVVCSNRGGYVEVIEHGRNGFLFDTELEAFETIQRLRSDAPLRRAVGRAARETVESLYSPMRRHETVNYYLR